LWKEDGNASGKPTPIRIAPLSADGLTVTGAATTLIENDRAWEGAVTEGPFMIEHAGQYVLFYSGNSYANATYAVGAARASAPTGPFTKEPAPILTTSSSWVGPGHCSVVDGPDGASVMVYHAWKAGCVNAPGCGRETMVDRVAWDGSGAPSVQLSPSANDRPAP
jgi:GH43 family beta-xylosidase